MLIGIYKIYVHKKGQGRNNDSEIESNCVYTKSMKSVYLRAFRVTELEYEITKIEH